MKSHFGTLVNCARQSPQCSELFSMFGSQSSHVLLLRWRALTKSISRDGSIFPAYLRAGPKIALSVEFKCYTQTGHYTYEVIYGTEKYSLFN